MEYWLSELHSGDESARYQASISLGKIGRSAVPALREALKARNPRVRFHAAAALAKMFSGSLEALPELIAALQDTDATVRARAARAIGRLEGDAIEAVPKLLPLLKAADRDCRLEAVTALGLMGHRAAHTAKEVVSLLQDSDLEVRRKTAEVLGQLQSADTVPHLIAAMQDPDRKVALYAAFSLRKIDRPTAAKYGFY